jgi:hypothetical protein
MQTSLTDTVDIFHLQARVKGQANASDAAALRLRLATLLSSAALRPRELPPSAILIIQRLADPSPGMVNVWQPTVRIDGAWERAVQSRLGELYRHAVRPHNGYLPASAEAVVFMDRSEMLACLALDLQRGAAVSRWWWQLILRRLSSQAAHGLYALLYDHAAYVPATLARLRTWGHAEAVVSRLTSEQAVTIVRAMCAAYGVGDLTRRSDAASEMLHAQSPQRYADTSARSLTHAVSRAPETPYAHGAQPSATPAPWDRWLLPTPALSPAMRCLFGIALALHHEPDRIRTSAYRRAVYEWWTAQTDAARLTSLTRPEASPRRQVPVRRAAAHRGQPLERLAYGPEHVVEAVSAPPAIDLHRTPQRHAPAPNAASASENSEEQPVGSDATDRDVIASWRRSSNPPAPRDHAPGHGLGGEVVQQSHDLEAEPPAASQTVASSRRIRTGPAQIDHGDLARTSYDHVSGVPLLDLERGIDTSLGGVLYLINLMLDMALLSHIEHAWRLGQAIGAWGMLEAIGRALISAPGEDVAHDAMWAALAQLDGRKPGIMPGEGLHVERAPEDENQPSLYDVTTTLAGGLSSALHYLLSGLMPTICSHLEQTLGWSNDAQSQRRALEHGLLRRPGRLYVTATHVDLVMSLEDISIPVRLAGLDRNPGWVPAFARVVQFHFE